MAATSRGRSPRVWLERHSWLERRRQRRLADEWIQHGFEARYRWRVAELTADRERRLLARDLRGVIGELHGTKVPGVTPLRTAALRPYVAVLEAIADRLARLDEPVSAVGVLLVQRLLASPASVLYEACDDVERTLDGILQRLEIT